MISYLPYIIKSLTWKILIVSAFKALKYSDDSNNFKVNDEHHVLIQYFVFPYCVFMYVSRMD